MKESSNRDACFLEQTLQGRFHLIQLTLRLQACPVLLLPKFHISGVLANAQTEFSIDMKSIRQQTSSSTTTTTTTTMTQQSSQQSSITESKRLSCQIVDPKGKTIPSKVLPGSNADVIRIMYTPFETGPHTIELLYDGSPLPGKIRMIQEEEVEVAAELKKITFFI